MTERAECIRTRLLKQWN